jgi:hypothetical protein
MYVHENGQHTLGWRMTAPSGCWYPVRGFKTTLDEHFQKLFTRQDRPTQEIYLRHHHPFDTFQ